MRTWTDILPLAMLAVLFTLPLAGCEDAGLEEPAGLDEDVIEATGLRLTPEDYRLLFRVYPARQAAEQAALDEIRRTFTVEDLRAERWVERWPEIWGPDGWGNVHSWPTLALADKIDFEVGTRHGAGWENDSALVAEVRKTMDSELDRYVFDGHVKRARALSAMRVGASSRLSISPSCVDMT